MIAEVGAENNITILLYL